LLSGRTLAPITCGILAFAWVYDSNDAGRRGVDGCVEGCAARRVEASHVTVRDAEELNAAQARELAAALLAAADEIDRGRRSGGPETQELGNTT
jgi:hypothetical protein